MADNKLSLNVAKTELMIIGSRQRLNAPCEEIDISIDDRTIKRVDHTKSLGLTIDAQLSWSKHVDEISKKVSSAIGALKRVRPFIPTDVAVQIYNALILPHFDYCSPVWDGLSGCLSDKLQKLQNRSARVITQSPFDTSSNLLLTMLKWEKLSVLTAVCITYHLKLTKIHFISKNHRHAVATMIASLYTIPQYSEHLNVPHSAHLLSTQVHVTHVHVELSVRHGIIFAYI